MALSWVQASRAGGGACCPRGVVWMGADRAAGGSEIGATEAGQELLGEWNRCCLGAGWVGLG